MKKKGKVVVALLSLMMMTSSLQSPMTAKAEMKSQGIGDYYTKDNEDLAVSGGGKLYSHTERQTYGTLSGKVRKVKFYVYGKYDGSQKVDSIKCAWRTGATLRKSATLTLSTSVGKEYSFGASASSTWQSVTSSEKYWLHTSGTKVSYEDSNFTIAPDADLSGFDFWVTTTATVYTKGYKKPTAISSGC